MAKPDSEWGESSQCPKNRFESILLNFSIYILTKLGNQWMLMLKIQKKQSSGGGQGKSGNGEDSSRVERQSRL